MRKDFKLDENLQLTITSKHLNAIRVKNYLCVNIGRLFYRSKFGKPNIVNIYHMFQDMGHPNEDETINRYFLNLIDSDLANMGIAADITINGIENFTVNNVINVNE